MDSITLRVATDADVPVIWALLKDLALYEKAPVFTVTEDDVRRDMLGAACHCDLAFRGDQPMGLVAWYWIYMSFRARRGIYVEDLFVRPEARGLGLGRKLMAQVAARAHGVGGYMEWRVLDWNEPAQSFYQGIGGKPVPQWQNYRLDGEALERFAP